MKYFFFELRPHLVSRMRQTNDGLALVLEDDARAYGTIRYLAIYLLPEGPSKVTIMRGFPMNVEDWFRGESN